MTEDAHIIEIENIVLDGVDPHGPGVRALIAAQVRHALRGRGLPVAPNVTEASVADVVARAVDRSIRGGANRSGESPVSTSQTSTTELLGAVKP